MLRQTRALDLKALEANGFATRQSDYAARDIARFIERAVKDEQVKHAPLLLRISPHCPYAMATMIEKDWEQAKTHLADWEQAVGDVPVMLGALARRFVEAGEIDKARDYLSRYIRHSPERWAYEMLAKRYKDRGDVARWREVLDQFLAEGEDEGLGKARVQVTIADDYMESGDWERAMPYAEAAAETWAARAMLCASRCAEGLKDWERAELWVQRTSERYPKSSLYDWFLFCKRTGHGDAPAASDFAEEFLLTYGDRPDLVDPERCGYFYWLGGATKKALASFRKAYEVNASISAAVSMVIVADQLDDTAQRNVVLDELVTKHKEKAPDSIRAMQMFIGSLGQDPRSPLDLQAIDRLIEKTPPDGRGNLEFLVGWFLRKHGTPRDARAYLERSTRSPNTYDWLRIIAIDALRGPEGDGDPAKVDPRTTS